MPDTEIIQSEPNEAAITPRDELEDRFIDNLRIYIDPREAARKAGYSETYAYNIRTNKLKNPKFIKKIKEHYNGYSSALLPAILNIESSVTLLSNDMLNDALTEADPDIKEDKISKALAVYTKTEHTRKQIKQSTGILSPDDDVRKPMIQVANIKNLLLNVHDDR